MVREYGPQYHVRIITSTGEINLDNVLSITTDKDIYADHGSFQIELNYDQHFFNDQLINSVTYSQSSVFFRIKPMDYVEIYLSHDTDKKFGVYDIKGKFVRDFDFNSDTQQPENKQDADAIGIVERMVNPHLVFCGFVDAIDNNFALAENSTNNRVIIRGKCLAKYLVNHHLFFNFPYDELFVRKVKGQIALLGLRPNEAIDLVMTNYLIGIMTTDQLQVVDEVIDKGQGKKIKSRKLKKKPSHTIIWHDKKKKGKDGQPAKLAEVLHNDTPSFRYLYWGTNLTSASRNGVPASEQIPSKGYFEWGRMQYVNTTNRNIMNITADAPLFGILKQSAQVPFNEFFVDEVGNIVLRRAIDAWDFNQGSLDTQDDKLVKDWVEIKEEDIINWNFSISDDELRTLILSIPVASMFGNMPIMVGAVGMAPVTEEIQRTFTDLDTKRFKQASDILKNKARGKTQVVNVQKEKQQLADTLQDIREKQANHLDEYPLVTKEDILNFWKRFGVRPESINDLYSDDFSKFYWSAWSLFQKYANYWWKGSITVKGDSKYKIGQKCVIKRFAKDKTNVIRDFHLYIHSVKHQFVWGEGWITQLAFTRGEIEGSTTSQDMEANSEKTKTDPKNKQRPPLAKPSIETEDYESIQDKAVPGF